MNNELISKIKNIYNNVNEEEINTFYNDMSKNQKKIFSEMINNSKNFQNYSFSDLAFDFDSDFINWIINLELQKYLDYCKNNDISNKRNGATKGIKLIIGNREVEFNRPRLRNEKDFDSVLIPKRTRILNDIHDNIILLYSKNNSINEIKEIFSSMFNINVSTRFISECTQDIISKINDWRNKQLEHCYFCINFDCTYIKIRDNKVLNGHDIPIYIVVGTTITGTKEIIGMYLGNEDQDKNIIDELNNTDISESKSFWINVFQDLKDRGVEKVLYCCSDGISGIEEALKEEFDGVIYQRCIVHLVRNLKKYTNKNNASKVIKDFKDIYTSNKKEEALLKIEEFNTKYVKEKNMLKHANSYFNLILPLFNQPANIRKYIYTNNIVESVNSKIKRGFYGRGALPNAQSAINIIFLNLQDLEKKWKSKKVNNWNNIFNELSILYKDIIDTYTK